jgi:UDP-glucuronate 4-epimerase
LEKKLGIPAKKNYLPMQPGDVSATAAEVSELEAWIGFKPDTSVENGISKFVDWYLSYYKVEK